MIFTGALPREWRGDGVIVMPPCGPDLLAYLRSMNLPCVALSGSGPVENLPTAQPDHVAIGRLAAEHLLGRSRRGFAWAPSFDDAGNRARLSGFEARLAEEGLTCLALPPRHVRVGRSCVNHWAEHRRLLVSGLHRLALPAAIFAADDRVAADVIHACREAGLAVPADVAVIGAGDSFACETSAVSISSIDENLEELAYRTAAMLGEMMDGDPAPARPVSVRPKGIVARLSTDVAAVKDRRVARALDYIAEHYPDTTLTVNTVARAAGMSRRNLERGFREETGGTVNGHITGVRMKAASRILRSRPEVTGAQVAALVGIAGAGTFFRAFRRFHGTSPGAHRGETFPRLHHPGDRPAAEESV